jgi:tetratricopeptide (TPR) repeat protein
LRLRKTCTIADGTPRNALLAETYAHLSTYHNLLEDYSKSLSAMQTAANLQRSLLHDITNPLQVRDALAYYLYRTAMLFSRLGQTSNAIHAIEESVSHREWLTRYDSVIYDADLALALHDLGVLLYNSGRYADAQDSVERAVGIRKKLVRVDRDNYARLLKNSEDALKAIRSARGRA